VAEILQILLAQVLMRRRGVASRGLRGVGIKLVCLATVMLCGVMIVACLVSALWIFAAGRVGGAAAPLVVALALALVGGITLFFMQRRAPRPDTADTALAESARLIAELRAQYDADKGNALLLALLTGLQAGCTRD
jgi:hypothetical protein